MVIILALYRLEEGAQDERPPHEEGQTLYKREEKRFGEPEG
jgi:hypothetical protein